MYRNTIIAENDINTNLMNLHIHSQFKLILPLTAMFNDTAIARIANPNNMID